MLQSNDNFVALAEVFAWVDKELLVSKINICIRCKGFFIIVCGFIFHLHFFFCFYRTLKIRTMKKRDVKRKLLKTFTPWTFLDHYNWCVSIALNFCRESWLESSKIKTFIINVGRQSDTITILIHFNIYSVCRCCCCLYTLKVHSKFKGCGIKNEYLFGTWIAIKWH